MNTIVVSDENSEILDFQYKVRKFQEIKILGTFENSEEAVFFTMSHNVDLVVICIMVREADGILLGKRFREIYPDILLLFILELEKLECHVSELLKFQATTFLDRNYSEEKLLYAIETVRLLSKRRKRRIYVRTFGHFDLFVDERPVMFRSNKAKELLALLIDRQGGTVNTDQIICALWEERPNDEATQNLCSKAFRSLKKELNEYGIQEILINKRGIRSVDTALFECDLYNLLSGDEDAKKQFYGEYMADYSWAEERIGQLLRYSAEG